MNVNSFLESVGSKIEEFADHDFPEHSIGTALAARYALLGGGKRLRPALVVASAAAFNPEVDVTPVAAAFEYVHTYSLIHDDLPVMDNDEIRRGRPACHIAFGVEAAVLAGALLLIKAFESIQDPRVRKVLEESAGLTGMVGGQALDILGEKRSATEDDLLQIHTAKTAALIRGSIVAGALAAEADESAIEVLGEVGLAAGLAFQIVDDLLDVESTAEVMGKPVGRDDARGKRTYPGIIGVEESRKRANELIRKAEDGLLKIGKKDTMVWNLIQFVTRRRV